MTTLKELLVEFFVEAFATVGLFVIMAALRLLVLHAEGRV